MMMMPWCFRPLCVAGASLASCPERAWLLLRRGRDSVVAIWHGHLQLPAHLPGCPSRSAIFRIRIQSVQLPVLVYMLMSSDLPPDSACLRVFRRVVTPSWAQACHGLPETGVADERTWQRLMKPGAEPADIHKVISNDETDDDMQASEGKVWLLGEQRWAKIG